MKKQLDRLFGGLLDELKEKSSRLRAIPELDAQWESAQSEEMPVGFEEIRASVERFLSLRLEEDRKADYIQISNMIYDPDQITPGVHAEFDVLFFGSYQQFCKQKIWMEAERRANQLLDAFYRRDKIRSQLLVIEQFMQRIAPTDDPVMIGDMGYNNYVYYLRKCTEETLRRYEGYTGTVCAREDTPEAVCEFIRIECQSVPGVRGVPRAWELIEQMQAENRTNSAVWSELNRLYEQFDARNSSAQQVLAVTRRLVETEEKRRETVEKAAQLHAAIQKLLTDEWFDMLNPDCERSGIREMTAGEIRGRYEKLMTPVLAELLSRY